MKQTISNLQLSKSINLNSDLVYTGFISREMVPSYIRLLVWLLQIEDKSDFYVVGERILRTWQLSGVSFTVQYLKESVLLIQHYVAGNPVSCIPGFPISIVRGLPRLIPGTLRSKIRKGDPLTIRGVLSILSLYRVMEIPPKWKLESITDPFTGISETLSTGEIQWFRGTLLRHYKDAVIARFPKGKLIPLSTAGPNSPKSALGLTLDAFAFNMFPVLKDKLIRFMELTNSHELKSLFLKELMWATDPYHNLTIERSLLKLGKLSTKVEAAGKIRVFAIVDGWTQSAFRGLTRLIEGILRSIPQDGTFDQDRPLKILMSRIREGVTSPDVWSYDLSSATDRLPIKLQQQVLGILFSQEISSLWGDLLVGREYMFKKSKDSETVPFTYSVGQPMGALSSWATMALTHHLIVQLSARRALVIEPHQWFEDYALLGDDIVIANGKVAEEYLSLMDTFLGVKINLTKSLVSSKGVVEFAKRLLSPEAEYTPVGPKNLLLAIKQKESIPSLFVDLKNKNFSFNSDTLVGQFNNIPFIKKEKLRNDLLWTVVGPFGFVPTVDRLSGNFILDNSLNTVRANILLSSIDDTLFTKETQRWEAELKTTIRNISQFEMIPFNSLSAVHGFLHSDLGLPPSYIYIWDKAIDAYYKLIVSKPVRRYIYDAPLGFSVYNKDFVPMFIEYVTKKVTHVREYPSSFNPMMGDRALPVVPKVGKNHSFFTSVRRNETDRLRYVTRSFLSRGINYSTRRNYRTSRNSPVIIHNNSSLERITIPLWIKLSIIAIIVLLFLIILLLLANYNRLLFLTDQIEMINAQLVQFERLLESALADTHRPSIIWSMTTRLLSNASFVALSAVKDVFLHNYWLWHDDGWMGITDVVLSGTVKDISSISNIVKEAIL